MTTDETAILAILTQLETAWNTQDAAGYAAPFATDANFIHIFGGQLDSRAAIEASHQYIFNTIYKGSRAQFTLQSIRFVRPDVAVAFTTAHLKFQDQGDPREVNARPTFILAKDNDQWQIVAFQNTRITEMPSAHQEASRLPS